MRRFVLLWVLLLAASVDVAWCQACYKSGVSMRFKPISLRTPYSFLNDRRRDSPVRITRTYNVPLIIIQVLDSNGVVDPLVSDTAISVSGTTRLGSNSFSQPVVYGEAYITDLVIEGSDAAYSLTFTATSTSSLSNLNGQSLTINVTNLANLVQVYAIRFAFNRSLFTMDRTPYTAVPNVPLPLITVNVVTSQMVTYSTSASLGSNFTIGAYLQNSVGGLQLAGATVVPVLDGVASFSALQLKGSGTTGTTVSPICFQLYNGPNSVTDVAPICTGNGTIATLVDYAQIGFADESTSAIYTSGQSLFATVGSPITVNGLPIVIQVLNNMGQPSPPSSGLVITATCGTCPPNSLLNNVVGVVAGFGTFTSLQFVSLTSSAPLVLTFTAGSQGSLPVAGFSIQTGAIRVLTSLTRAVSLAFFSNPNDSLFNAEGQSAQVVLALNLHTVRVQVLNSDGSRTTASGVTVTASATSGVQFTSITVPVTSGIAEFTALQFLSSKPSVYPRITFTAGGSSTYAVFGTTLITGVVTVAPIESNFAMQFQPYGAGLFSQSNEPAVATTGVPLPPIIIELITSAGSVDSSSSEVSITATSPSATLSNNFLRVSSGVAVFSSLTFVSEIAGTYVITFTAGNEGATNVAGKTL